MAQSDQQDGPSRKVKKQKSEDEKFPTGQMITLGMHTPIDTFFGSQHTDHINV